MLELTRHKTLLQTGTHKTPSAHHPKVASAPFICPWSVALTLRAPPQPQDPTAPTDMHTCPAHHS